MNSLLEIFRVAAAEFAETDDSTVNIWLDLTAPLVSRKRFGEVYEQALALLTAHRMKIAAEIAAAAGANDDIGGFGAALKVSRYSVGSESVSFNNAALTSTLSPDAELIQTVYGVQYLTLRGLHSIAIINSGEGRA